MRSKPANLFAIAAVCWLVIACQSLYTGAVSLTAVVDQAAKDYAKLFNDGLIAPEVAVKVSNAHAQYRKAGGLAADALEIVKAGGQADPKAALEAARVAANHFIDSLFGVLQKSRVNELRAQITKATKV